MKRFFFGVVAFLGVFHQISGAVGDKEYSIVLIHIGNELPSYIHSSISQAHLFNPDCDLVLIANERAISSERQKHKAETNIFPDYLNIVSCETLKASFEHEKFQKYSPHKPGLWRYSVERFLYLEELIAKLKLKDVFQLESDNMLYVNLGEMLPIFRQHYQGIGAVFDNDDRCIPSVVYFRNEEASRKLALFIAKTAKKELTDMALLAVLKNESGKDVIDHLPIIMRGYVQNQELKSPAGHRAKNPLRFSEHDDLFLSVFDAAALGQFLGGIDPRNGPSQPGFINESCVFNPALLSYVWERDAQGRKIPYAIYQDKKYRINNLHIHCKNLDQFSSN